MKPFSSLFVFDIETIPDIEAAANLLDVDSCNVEELRDKLTQYHLDATDGKNSFYRQVFHKVACISFVCATIERKEEGEFYKIKEIRSGGDKNSSESELMKGLFTRLEKERPRLVSFNGRTFDLPVLKYRAMKYNIPLKWFYNSGDKWNSYNQRYSLDWNCDLLEAFSDFGASARIKMKEICALLSIPCKYGVDGSQVAQMYDEGRIEEIRDYCEIDALITYILYLKYALHTGLTSPKLYELSMQDWCEYLEKNSATKKNFAEFYELYLSLQM